MPRLEKLMDYDRREQLAREYSHPSSGYQPTKEEIQQAIDIGQGRLPREIAYGEKPLGGGLDIAEVGRIPINATDFIGTGIPTKLAMLSKIGAPLAFGGMVANRGDDISKLVLDAERAMADYERKKLLKPKTLNLRDLAIGGGALGAGGLAGYYGVGALNEN